MSDEIVCIECGSPKIFNKSMKLCASCLAKRSKGKPKNRKPKAKEPQAESQEIPQPKPKAKEPESVPAALVSDEVEYLCEGCNARVSYAQRKCRNCGIYPDWRGSPVETDPDIIICPDCGAMCGYTEDNPEKCPHCGKRA